MLAEVDLFARVTGIAGIALGALAFAYGVFRDRRDRPQVDLSATVEFIIGGKANWVEVSLIARNRGPRDVGIEGIDFRSVHPRKDCVVQLLFPEQDEDNRMLQKRRTLQGRHSFEWRAVPRYTCPPDDDLPDRVSLIAVVMLGDGKEVRSDPVQVPTRTLRFGDPFEIRPDDLDDRAWFLGGND
jgi:hypothetical protein